MERRKRAASELQALETAYNNAQTDTEKERLLRDLLNRFPLLYGFWLKLINLKGNTEIIWKEALSRCPTLDLWTLYLQSPSGASIDAAEAAVHSIGTHYQSHPIWDQLLSRNNNDPSSITTVLDLPLYAYAKFYQLAYDNHTMDETVLAEKSTEISGEVNTLWQFESKLTRPYFHVYDVAEAELKTWIEYLEYTENKQMQHPTRIIQLYERCLVTTALYPEFWLMYIKWLDLHNYPIVEVLDRAIHYHPTDVTFHAVHSKLQGKEVRDSNANLDEVSSSILFEDEFVDPKAIFYLYEKGLCPDAVKYANRLRLAGYLREFFAVDKTLGYC